MDRRFLLLPFLGLFLVGLTDGCASGDGTATNEGTGGTGGAGGSIINPGGPFFGSGGKSVNPLGGGKLPKPPVGGGGGASGAGDAGKGGSPAGKGGSDAGKGGSAGKGTAGQGEAGTTTTFGGGGTSATEPGDPPKNNCGLSTNNPTCDACLDSACCTREQDCASNPQCVPLLQCVSQCSSASCANNCGAQFQGAVQAYNELITCFQGQCGSACGSGGDPQGGMQGGAGTGTTGPGDPPATDDDAQYCVDRINQYRATLGLPALERWFDAEKCSDGEAKQDSQSGQAHGAFGQCGEFGQNECPGWGGPIKDLLNGCLQMMWDEGPGADFGAHGHYLNMSSTKFSRVACGFSGTTGSIWAVQNFQLIAIHAHQHDGHRGAAGGLRHASIP